MSRYRTAKQWKAAHESLDRKNYWRAGVARGAKSRTTFASSFTPFVATGAGMAPVKVYGPDGTLKEIVTAKEWRIRHGDPFKGKGRELAEIEAGR